MGPRGLALAAATAASVFGSSQGLELAVAQRGGSICSASVSRGASSGMASALVAQVRTGGSNTLGALSANGFCAGCSRVRAATSLIRHGDLPRRGLTMIGKFAKRVRGDPAFGDFEPDSFGVQRGHVISWYPGHIAKAERELQEYLKLVDVVIEVRDARIPASTTHPLVPQWVGKRPLIVVFNRRDMAAEAAVDDWQRYLTAESGNRDSGRAGNVPVFFVDSKRGKGVHNVKRAALRAGAAVNERRMRRGVNPRGVRVAVIGFPNVGKSALINRLCGKAVAASRNMPGVTKKLTWIRVGGGSGGSGGSGRTAGIGGGVGGAARPDEQLELLDSPGIIPARHGDQLQALRLAICNDIGQASYDPQIVAAAMLDLLVDTSGAHREYLDLGTVRRRYGMDPTRTSGEQFLEDVAESMYHGDKNAAADKLLGDFRKGFFGRLSLEAPPSARAQAEAVAATRAAAEVEEAAAPAAAAGEGGASAIGAAAMASRQFVGQGDFEGW